MDLRYLLPGLFAPPIVNNCGKDNVEYPAEAYRKLKFFLSIRPFAYLDCLSRVVELTLEDSLTAQHLITSSFGYSS
jgi:hypothetical protein